MGVAVEPPIRIDLSCRDDDDKLVSLAWRLADQVTPIPITSAKLVLAFDLPNDDTWARDPDTDAPIPPVPQRHIITSTTPGHPAGWIDSTGWVDGLVRVYLTHTLWSTYLAPHTGVWDVVAVSTDAVQRCLARGEFTMETSA